MILFRADGYGYGLGAKVQIALPSGVRLARRPGRHRRQHPTWTVPGGSTVRLQQMLAIARLSAANVQVRDGRALA